MQEKVDFPLMASVAQAVKGKLVRANSYELKRLKAGRGDTVLFRFHDAVAGDRLSRAAHNVQEQNLLFWQVPNRLNESWRECPM